MLPLNATSNGGDDDERLVQPAFDFSQLFARAQLAFHRQPVWWRLLSLFGQEPDSVIKAFTETADWNLSIKILAQNLNMIDITYVL